jgi:hypothetical protein
LLDAETPANSSSNPLVCHLPFLLSREHWLVEDEIIEGHQLARMRGFNAPWRRVTPNLKTKAGGSVEGKVMAISPICDWIIETISGAGEGTIAALENPKDAKKHSE